MTLLFDHEETPEHQGHRDAIVEDLSAALSAKTAAKEIAQQLHFFLDS